jgi:hypothetical protein
MSHVNTFNDIKAKLTDTLPHFETVKISTRTEDAEAAIKLLMRIHDDVNDFHRLCLPLPTKPLMTTVEKDRSLVESLEKLATSRGALCIPLDTALALVIENCDSPELAQQWGREHKETLIGFIHHRPVVRDGLRERGVLAWFDYSDRLIRVVDTQWLTAHEAIIEYVTGPNPPGCRCRFCRLPESNHNGVLTASTEQKHTYRDGLRTPDYVMLHAECTPHWQAWVTLVRRYASIADAQAADAAAGRTQRAVPLLPEIPAVPEPDISGLTGE